VSGSGAVLHTINPRLFEEPIVYIANHAEDQFLADEYRSKEFRNVIDKNFEGFVKPLYQR